MTFELLSVTKLMDDPQDNQYILEIKVTSGGSSYVVTMVGIMQE